MIELLIQVKESHFVLIFDQDLLFYMVYTVLRLLWHKMNRCEKKVLQTSILGEHIRVSFSFFKHCLSKDTRVGLNGADKAAG